MEWTNVTSKCNTFVGGGLQSYVKANYDEMVALFGEPQDEIGGDGKVSTKWIFKNSNEIYVNVCDYKMTNQYSKSYPTVSEFRNICNIHSYNWHIGSLRNNDALMFKDYLENKLLELRNLVMKNLANTSSL